MYGLDVNFLKDRQLQTTVKPGSAGRSRPTIAWGQQVPLFIGAGIGLSLAALTALTGILLNLQMQKTRSNIAVLEAEINQLNAKTQQLEEVQRKLQAMEGEGEALVTVFNQLKPWSPLLQELRRQVPVKVGIDSIEEVPIPPDPANQEPAKTLIRVQGVAADYESVNNFLLTLQDSEFIQAQKARIESVEKKPFPAKLVEEIKDTEVKFPEAIAYSIAFERSNLPASQLLSPLSRNGAIGLVTRLKTLEQKGVLKP